MLNYYLKWTSAARLRQSTASSMQTGSEQCGKLQDWWSHDFSIIKAYSPSLGGASYSIATRCQRKPLSNGLKPAVPPAARGSSQSRGRLVMISEEGGQQCFCPGIHKGWVTYKAGGRDHFENTSCADLTVSKENPLSSWGALRVSVEKLWSPHQLPIATKHQVPDVCFSFMTGIWLLWHETSQERFPARGEGKILLQESAAFSSQQGGLWGGGHNDIFGEKYTLTGFISHIRISRCLKG